MKGITPVVVGALLMLFGMAQRYHIAHPAPGTDPQGLVMGCAMIISFGAILVAFGTIRIRRSRRAIKA